MRVLVLGGTAEARAVAARLVDRGDDVVSSLAGRVSSPALPVGGVRVGGFGGVAGLRDFVVAEGFSVVIDATHPFAARITAHAAEAVAPLPQPLVRLRRPGWEGHPHAASFTWAEDVAEARDLAGALGSRPFLTTGRQQLDAFASWTDRYVLVRVVDPPEWPLPPTWDLLRARGPFTLDAELALMRGRAVDVLVSKDSGGPLTQAKLEAAHVLGVPVVVVRRPAEPAGATVVQSVDDAVVAIDALTGQGRT
ncbi:precorrin-6A reductase [Humibacillus xanthopallidus]|uniref:Precorrin-6A reductase n=1 Tax=Humibacillus xanthopallidus TaxID=412689 RepID=A0A543PL49_9MICO|nr:cobalt-precorrin-6A reductase [Humibacillus xanthopallidus]TQN44801.1 precorrin-6A reductase [Humibacillus xanthopallidus]